MIDFGQVASNIFFTIAWWVYPLIILIIYLKIKMDNFDYEQKIRKTEKIYDKINQEKEEEYKMFKFYKKKKQEIKTESKNKTIKKISATQLSKKLKMSKSKLDKILISLKYITEENKELTELGKNNSGEYKEDKRFGRHIIWDENIDIEIKEIKPKQEEKPKRMTNKEKKEKGDIYEKYICELFLKKGYRVIEHGKEKGIKDCGIDLIIKKDRNVLFVQCKNWEQKYKSKLTNKDIQYIRMNVRDFLDNNEIYKFYDWKISFISSQDILGASGKHVINEFKDEVEYLVIPIENSRQRGN